MYSLPKVLNYGCHFALSKDHLKTNGDWHSALRNSDLNGLRWGLGISTV